MKYFDNPTTLEELKKQYRALALKHHPDIGGDEETMKAINNEHDALFKILKDRHNAAADEKHQTTETPEEFRRVVDILMRLDGLEVELCGSWLWIGGNTRPHKEELKAAGCRWSQKKALWYWRHAEDAHSWHRGTTTIEEIRHKYGSQKLRGRRQDDALPA